MASKHTWWNLDEILITRDFNDLSCCGWRGEANGEEAKVHPSTASHFPSALQKSQHSGGRSQGSLCKVGESHIILAPGPRIWCCPSPVSPQHVNRSIVGHLAMKRIMGPLSSPYSIYSLSCVLVSQSCLTLCDPVDCRLPGSSVHGILQAKILE